MQPLTLDGLVSDENLPTLPTVAVEVLRITGDQDFCIDDLARVIQNDPALTAKLLKVVNSSLFGVPREVRTVQQAMSLLGWRTVRVMALSFSLVSTTQATDDGSFDYELFWRRSLTGAAAARLLAKIVAPSMSEEAFVTALLADLGSMMTARCAPERYKPVLEQASRGRGELSQIELELLGTTHAAIGRELLLGWGLPGAICSAVASHHGEGLAKHVGGKPTLDEIVFTAMSIAGLFCGDAPGASVEEVKALCASRTDVNEHDLESLLSNLDEHVCNAASMLSISIGKINTYAQIQADAMTRLAQLSMEAEVERAATAQQAQTAREDVSRLKQERSAILEQALTDGLTGLANRSAFDKRLDEAIGEAARLVGDIALIMLDVDHFKLFNDAKGHQAGDAVLQAVGRVLRDAASDVEFPARYGGEEFAVIVTGASAEKTLSIAERLRGALEAMIVVHEGASLQVTASFGVAIPSIGDKTLDAAALIKEADRALYKAKRAGRNRVEVVHPDAEKSARAA